MAAPYRRAGLVLGLAAIASTVFVFIRSGDLSLVRIAGGAAVAVSLGLGALAVVGAWLGRRLLLELAGVGFALAATVQLVQLGREPDWFGGNGSTFSLWLGFAVGLLAVGVTRPADRKADEDGSG